MYFPRSRRLESKAKASAGWCLAKARLLVQRQLSSLGVLAWQKGHAGSPGSSMRARVTFRRAPFLGPQHLPQVPPPDTVTLGIRFQRPSSGKTRIYSVRGTHCQLTPDLIQISCFPLTYSSRSGPVQSPRSRLAVTLLTQLRSGTAPEDCLICRERGPLGQHSVPLNNVLLYFSDLFPGSWRENPQK